MYDNDNLHNDDEHYVNHNYRIMYKKIPQSPLTGMLDFRSPVEDLEYSSFRWRENFNCLDSGKLCRAAGWEKLLSRDTLYGNMDLHDQLLPLQEYYDTRVPPVTFTTPDGVITAADVEAWPNATFCDDTVKVRNRGREAFTFGMEMVSSYGARKLIVGTQSRLYLANTVTRNYQILGDGFGGSAKTDLSVYWGGDYLNDVAVFTNDVNPPVYWPLNGAPRGCAINRVRPIPDLQTIGLSKAKVVVQYKGSVFLFNVVLDGKRYGNMGIWSDFGNAIGFDPADQDSITGRATLPDSNGEFVLAAMVLADDLIVLTDKAIYVGNSTGNSTGNEDLPFEFRKHYSGDRALVYPRTLVNTGTQLVYAGEDTIYVFSTYQRDPMVVDWVDKAAGIMFKGAGTYLGLNTSCCGAHNAGFQHTTETEKKVWISWAEVGSCSPSKTLVLDFRHEFAATIDAGFTMYVDYRLDERPTFRDFLLQYCGCTAAEIAALGLDFIKEGQPIELCDGPTVQSIKTQTLGMTFGITTEDWSAEADSDSLCAALGGKTLDDFCKECISGDYFIGALSADWCLKQIGTAYSRELCTNPTTATGDGTDYENVNGVYSSFPGTYSYLGYNSRYVSAANAFGSLRADKNINFFWLDADPVDQMEPCAVQLRLGDSFTARDPNSLTCGLVWSDPVRRYFKCPNILTPAQYKAQGLRTDTGIEFPMYTTGLFLYTEVSIIGISDQDDLDSAETLAIGGAGCITSAYHSVSVL